MSVISEQATLIPSIQRTPVQLLKDAIRPQDLFVLTPNIVILDGIAILNRAEYVIKTLHNMAIEAVYFTCDGSTPSSSNFHGVLAGGTAEDDGTGGYIDLSRFRGEIRILASSGSPRVAVFVARLQAPNPSRE
jgi:hypothetical protein